MSENTPSSDNGGLNDPLKLRNTDTGTLKRVPAATPSIASSAARKTIKLKPLTATPDAEGTVSTATIPMGQAPQSRTVSTATIPLSPSPKPVSMPPPKPSAVPTTTQGIARPKPLSQTAQPVVPKPVPTTTQGIARPKPVAVPPKPAGGVVPTTTQGIARPSSHSTLSAVHQSGLQTAKPAIKLRPSAAPGEAPATPSAASSAASQTIKLAPKPASAVPPPAETAAAPSAASASAQTLKLTPKTPSTVAPVPPPEEEGGETKTIRIPKKSVPSPSAAPASAQTIKLTPKTPSTVAPVPPPAEPAPAAPQAPKLSIPSKAPVAPQPSDPTVSLHVQGDIPTTKGGAVKEAEDQAIKLEQEKASEEEAKAKEAALKAAKKGKDEPSLFFAICACLTLVLMLYVVYAMSAQYFNQWSEQSIPVFGFEQIKLK